MDRQALNQYLKAFDLSVKELSQVTSQSPQTLRNWYGKGMIKDKSHLVLAIIAAVKWRKHYLRHEITEHEFKANETLTSYLEPHKITVEELLLASRQSNQTLNNWVKSPEKQMLVKLLIDAVHWYRFGYETRMLPFNPSFKDISSALLEPIVDSHNKTQFTLAKFIKRSSRKHLRKWTDR